MKFPQLLQGGLLHASLVLAQTYPITGISVGVDPTTGARPARLNIVDLQTSGAAWDLYILALQNFTMDPAEELTSYFQTAGIHGYPNIPWDGVQGNGGGVGFCTHGSVLFPSWHRPYMALFEQILWNKAQYIAQQYPDSEQSTYVAAAETLRVPYWDWTMQVGFPAIVNTSQISINTPSGQQTIANPLYTYHIPDMSQIPTGGLPDIIRSTYANNRLTSMASSLHSNMYQLMSRQSDYLHFADAGLPTHFPGRPPTGWAPLSLEAQHNNIHMTVGGQMSDLRVAAFDPVFWLHHANVDRILAIYQAIHPDLYVVPYPSTSASYITPFNTTEDINSPLYPFHSDDQGTVYTSTTARSTSEFGYTYPEIVDWGMNANAASLKSNVTAVVNIMYNSKAQAPSGASRRSSDLSDGNAAEYNWMLNIVANTKELEDSVFIYFYMTTPPSDPTAWPTDKSVLTIVPVLVNQAMKSDDAMDLHQGIANAQASISGSLMQYVSDVNPTTALPLLQSNLQWRASWSNGTAISADEMESFNAVNVTLAGQTVQQAESITEFPTYGDIIIQGHAGLGVHGGKVLS